MEVHSNGGRDLNGILDLNIPIDLATLGQSSLPMEIFLPLEEQQKNRFALDDQSEEERIEKLPNHRKLCSRGHWKPHEDVKLQELVAQYGPHNWNMIAKGLEGRSGINPYISSKAQNRALGISY